MCASFLSPANREQMSVVLLLMMPGTVAACTEWCSLEGPRPEAEGQGPVTSVGPLTPVSLSRLLCLSYQRSPGHWETKEERWE